MTGPLHTKGTSIVDAKGDPVRLTGINLQGMQYSNDSGSDVPDACGHAWGAPPPRAAEDIREWGFNSVRLPISWANIEPAPPTLEGDGTLTHHWSQPYLSALDGVIASLRAQDLAVILDPAQYQWSSAFKEDGPSGGQVNCEGYGMPSWLNPGAANERIAQARCDFIANRPEPGVPQRPWDGLSALWTMLGDRYGTAEAVVAADTFNEPFFVQRGCVGADFPGFFRTIGTAIRSAVPHWLLIFEYVPGQALPFGLTFPPPFRDQVYSIHIYSPDWATAKEEFMDPAWAMAQEWGMPLFVGEFSAFGATRTRGPDPGWQEESRQMLADMKQRGISWTVFGYWGGLSLITRSGEPKAEVIRILQDGF